MAAEGVVLNKSEYLTYIMLNGLFTYPKINLLGIAEPRIYICGCVIKLLINKEKIFIFTVIKPLALNLLEEE